jgi:acetolactate synthase-1/2/3 large subunit
MFAKPSSAARVRRPDAAASVTGGAAVWEALARLGVTHVFGYPGGAILPTYDALPEARVAHVLVRHEQAAAHMADGFARATGRVGVAMSTSGPGATNLVTGIATAMMDGSPIVCITGQVSSRALGLDAFQEVDITGVTMPITKHNYLVTEAADIAPAIVEAFDIAASGRPGPVLVDITRDAQLGSCTLDPAAWVPRRRARRRNEPLDADACAAALRLVNAAQRPVIVAGHGVIASGATRALRAFAERARIPVATTLLGIGGLPGSHPLNLGMVGMHGDPWVNEAVQGADVILALGARFDERSVGDVRRYARGATRIQVDIDPAEIGKTVSVDVGIVGDVAQVLRALLPGIERGEEHARRAAWLAQIESARTAATAVDAVAAPDGGALRGPHVMRALWQETRGKALVVTDVGQHQMWEAQHYRHEEPRSHITSGGLGTMGFGLPAAIGAKIGRPEAEVWVVAGDGGFQMTAAELSTVAQENLALRIAVVNNGRLGMVRQWQELFHQRRYTATTMHGPDFCKLAEAHGIPALRVESCEAARPAIAAARRTDGPVLLEFKVESEDLVYPMVPPAAGLDEMLRRPRPGPRRLAAAPR